MRDVPQLLNAEHIELSHGNAFFSFRVEFVTLRETKL